MTREFHKNTRLSCADAASLLNTRLIGDPLPQADADMLEQHLQDCSACAEFEVLARGLTHLAPPVDAARIRHEASYIAARFFEKQQKRRTAYRAAVVLGAAAVLVATIVSFYRPVEAPPVLSATMSCSASPPEEVQAGVWITHCLSLPPQFNIDHNDNLDIDMQRGGVGVLVNANRPGDGTIEVRTPHGTAVVTGTIFTVHVEQEDSRVQVFRGSVLASPRGGTHEGVAISQGQGAWMSRADSDKHPVYRNDTLAASLLAMTQETQSCATTVDPNTSPVFDTEGPVAPDAGRHPRTVDLVPDSDVSSPDPIPSLEGLLQEATDCLVRQKWQCAAARYRQLLTHYSDRWESRSALISLAKVELRHLNRPAKAKHLFTTYRKRFPNGPLLEDAVLGLAECERRLGNTADERRILRTFIQHHPDSPLAANAKKRIAEIAAAP